MLASYGARVGAYLIDWIIPAVLYALFAGWARWLWLKDYLSPARDAAMANQPERVESLTPEQLVGMLDWKFFFIAPGITLLVQTAYHVGFLSTRSDAAGQDGARPVGEVGGPSRSDRRGHGLHAHPPAAGDRGALGHPARELPDVLRRDRRSRVADQGPAASGTARQDRRHPGGQGQAAPRYLELSRPSSASSPIGSVTSQQP
uniref:Uncharacterized protein n=1 Tax=Janibacter limosus TaxID=53458 RepID=A0AC61U1M1_9MICO|nr:hypothetical protein [Janibacter limosus]